MSHSVKLYYLLLFMIISSYHVGLGDKPYKVIHFKVPKNILRQALQPTPVLKSPVTITVPINVQDEDDTNIDIVDDVTEAAIEDVIDTNVTEVVQDEVPVLSSTTPKPAVTQNPDLQDEVVAPEQEVPGQVIRFPCSCRERQCGCCTGTILDRINMKACGNITFVPEDFVFDVRMSVNNNTVVRRRVSASDPPPICFNPRRAPFVQVCAEISNIRIRNRNAHACLDINADIAGLPIYSAPFRCFSLGASGYQAGSKPKPISPGPKPINLFGGGNNDDGGFLENAANTVFGGSGLFGGGDSDGPFGAIGDALGDFLDGA